MAARLRKFKVFGAFSKKSAAVRSEREHHGFILKRIIEHHKRYVVLRKRG